VQTVKTPGDISDGGYNAAIIVPASRRRTGTAGGGGRAGGEGGGEGREGDTLGFLSTAAFRRGTRSTIGETPIVFISLWHSSRVL